MFSEVKSLNRNNAFINFLFEQFSSMFDLTYWMNK